MSRGFAKHSTRFAPAVVTFGPSAIRSSRAPLAGARLRPLARLAAENWPLVLVLAAALAIRIAAAIAYRPALFVSDSWGYLAMASKFPVSIAPTRPSGYPFLIELIPGLGPSVTSLTLLQHLAGLVVAVVVYALLVRQGVGRLLATLAAAVIALDGYLLALEQHVLSEAFLTLFITVSFYLAVAGRRTIATACASGLLLAFACLMHPDAVFLAPPWLVYMLFAYRGARARVVAVSALVLPVAIYAGLHGAKTGEFGLTQSEGWFLYGRVAQIADCTKLATPPPAWRGLCVSSGAPVRTPIFYVWDRSSPTHQTLGGISSDPARQRHTNTTLRGFALSVIAGRPAAYSQLVLSDFLRYFEPWRGAQSDDYETTALPRAGPYDAHVDPQQRAHWVPDYVGVAHPPANALNRYRHWIHLPRVLLAALVFCSLLWLVLRAAMPRRLASANTAAIAVLVAAGLFKLLGSVATADFAVRYLVPVAPLLVCGGVLSFDALARTARSTARLRSSRAS